MKFVQWLAMLGIFVAQQVWAEPPTRAVRVSALEGKAVLQNLDDGSRMSLQTNLSLGGGYAIETDRFAKAELRIGSTILRLDEETNLELIRLDDERLDLLLHYGTLAVQVNNPALLPQLSVQTKQGYAQWQTLGSGSLKVERLNDNVNLKVFSGQVLYAFGGNQFTVTTGHQVDFYRDDTSTKQVSYNEFDRWGQSRDLAYNPSQDTLRNVSREATGYEELDKNGTWRDTMEYGAIWVPNSANWMPYRNGDWRWIAPWGWTWIDQTPWAYVTSHYGRWVWMEQNWAWVPGRLGNNPAWSPALVGWASNGEVTYAPTPNSSVSWFPLGPREVWIPTYAYSDRYAMRFNSFYLPHQHRGPITPPVTYIYRDKFVPGQHDQFTRSPTVAVPAPSDQKRTVNGVKVPTWAAGVMIPALIQKVVGAATALGTPSLPAAPSRNKAPTSIYAPSTPVANPSNAAPAAPANVAPPIAREAVPLVGPRPSIERPTAATFPGFAKPASSPAPAPAPAFVKQAPVAPVFVGPSRPAHQNSAPAVTIAPAVVRPTPTPNPAVVGPAPSAEPAAQKAKAAQEARKREEEERRQIRRETGPRQAER